MRPGTGSVLPDLNSEAITASGREAEKLSLPALQSKMKVDPEGYVMELQLVYSQFKSTVELFNQQAAMSFTSVSGIAADPTVAKSLGDRAMFLAHVTPKYPRHLNLYPQELADFLRASARALPSGLRVHVTEALILLINRERVKIRDVLALFMELQTLGDRVLRTLAFNHIVHSIKKMNQKSKNDSENRALQNVLFSMLQQEDETIAKRALVTLCELHRRKVWFDERTANAICNACFHPSKKIMIAALSFLLHFENNQNDADSDDSDGEEELKDPNPQIMLDKESVYKAKHKGTSASKKKKKAKLQRVIRSMKKQQRVSSANNDSSYYSPLNHLQDPQEFAEKLFSRLQNQCKHERFEVRMMMLKVVTRTIGLHRLLIEKIYEFLQKYVQPHQRGVTSLLAAAVQACHDMVPPEFVEPLFRQIVNQFVHDKSRTEAISVGLNVVREICLRIPLLMTEDLLQDLVLYKKSHEKSVSSAARSLVSMFREVCPSLLHKKDRGRPTNSKAMPKPYGEVKVAANVPGIELLEEENSDNDSESDAGSSDQEAPSEEEGDDVSVSDGDYDGFGNDDGDLNNQELSDGEDVDSEEDNATIGSEEVDSEEDVDSASEDDANGESDEDEHMTSSGWSSLAGEDASNEKQQSKTGKRKYSDFGEQLNAASQSLRALKRMAAPKISDPADANDGFLSNEDYQRIKELTAKKETRTALTSHGFKVPSSDKLTLKSVNADTLEANLRRKMTKDERLALIREVREERGKYQAKAAVKKKKVHGLSNKEKEHKKRMPLIAKRNKIKRSRVDKRKKQRQSGKQFRGRKAWK